MAIETLNGSSQSWANGTFVFDVSGAAPVEDADIKGVNFETAVERGMQRGQGGALKKYTIGMETPTASMSLYADGAEALFRGLMAAAEAGNFKDSAGRLQIGMVPFNLVINHSKDGEADIRTVKILGCKLGKDAMALAEGTDSDVVECDLHPLKIVRVIDGKEVVML
jgi:hypothetical protein